MSTVLCWDDLAPLKDKFLEHMYVELIQANQLEELEILFEKNNFEYSISEKNKETRILVVGDSELRRNELEMVAVLSGVDPSKIDFILLYDEVRKFDFSKLRNSKTYSHVLVGPMGHKQKGLENKYSIISQMEESEEYPEVIRIENSSRKLEINKNSFSRAINQISI